MLRAYGDGNLFGEPYGEGPVQVVLLHGWARRGGDFAESARELARRGVASVALDLPGFGSSPVPEVAGGARHYAELVVPALLSMGDGPVVLVGHSFGGRIATVIAAQRPDLVRALVLTGVPLLRLNGPRRAPWRFRAVRFANARGWVGDARMEAARQRYGSSDYRNASGVMRAVLVANVNEGYEDELSRIVAPVSMLWGDRDEVAPLSVATRSAALLTCPYTLRTLEGVGHLVPTEAPLEIVRSVQDMLK
ncbi:MAG: alpha/beta hydrolase [Acidimicrobiales bacterium]